jgi:hypothetical protein
MRASMGGRRPIQLLAVAKLEGPIAVGFRRPAILLPSSLFDDIDAMDWDKVLRHELAHLRRYDDWTNLWEQVIRAVWFFHPAVWWLTRKLDLDREIACDDHVLAAQNQARSYALFLTQFAGRTASRTWAIASGGWSHHSQLKQRIDMLLDQHRNTSPRLARTRTGTLIITALVAAATAFQFAPRLAFGEENQTPVPTTDDRREPSPIKVVADDVRISSDSASNPFADFVTEEAETTIMKTDGGKEIKVIKTRGNDPVITTSPRPARISSAGTSLSPDTREDRTVVIREMTVPRANQLSQLPHPPHPPLPPLAPSAPSAHPRSSAFDDAASEDFLNKQPDKRTRPSAIRSEERLELRLEKLERMVESLLRGESASILEGNPGAGANSLNGDEQGRTIARYKSKTSGTDDSDFPFRFEWDRFQEQYTTALQKAERDIEKAREQAEQARKEMLQDQARRQDGFGQLTEKDALAVERQALREQRRALQQQMEALDRQLEKLDANARPQATNKETSPEESESLRTKPKHSKAKPSN